MDRDRVSGPLGQRGDVAGGRLGEVGPHLQEGGEFEGTALTQVISEATHIHDRTLRVMVVMRTVTGFDLDMTLVDSVDGIVASVQHVCRGYGVEVAAADIAETIGLPLDMVFPLWLPDEPYAALLAGYRAHYAEFGVPQSRPMPGAPELLDFVHTQLGHSVVVTAKHTPIAQRVLEAAGLRADLVVGDLFAVDKAEVLLAEQASYYVGDHPGDMIAARHANAIGIGVTTGPSDADALRAAGADVVLADLTAVTDWLRANTDSA